MNFTEWLFNYNAILKLVVNTLFFYNTFHEIIHENG